MKKDIRLFIDSKKNYFLVDKKIVCCDKCGCELDNIFFMVIDWAKKKSNLFITCNQCLIKIEKLGTVFEAKYGMISKTVEPDFSPVFIHTPSIVDSNNKETVFSACELSSDKTINKAWRSKEYPSLEGATIGKSIEEITQEKDVPLNEVEAFKLIEELGNPKNLISNSKKNKKLLR